MAKYTIELTDTEAAYLATLLDETIRSNGLGTFHPSEAGGAIEALGDIELKLGEAEQRAEIEAEIVDASARISYYEQRKDWDRVTQAQRDLSHWKQQLEDIS